MSVKNIAVTVYGKVQGVFFRKHAKEKALLLGLNGFVKNMADGSVYAEASGSQEAIADFIAWCHKGPAWAKVEKVVVKDLQQEQKSLFEIKYF